MPERSLTSAGCGDTPSAGAQVSQKHCGFIVNTGNATCADVLCLADTVCKIVTDETGFRLEKEVRVVK